MSSIAFNKEPGTSTSQTGRTAPFELDSLLLTRSNRLPNDEEVSIMKKQLEEDKHDLKMINARIDAANAEIEEKNKLLKGFKTELDEIRLRHVATAQQLATENLVQTSFTKLARCQESAVSQSGSATELKKIHSEYMEKSQGIITKTMQGYQDIQEEQSRRISILESSARHHYACLGLLSDRKDSLIANRDLLINSIADKRALLGWTRLLPTETLVQIFLITLQLFINERIEDPDSAARHPVLYISHVCQRWRRIAVDTTSLWHYVPVYGLPGWLLSSQLSTPTQVLCERARNTKDWFVDLTMASKQQPDNEMHHWARLLELLLLSQQLPLALNGSLTVRFSSKAPVTLSIHNHMVEKYVFYNIYPQFTTSLARSVTSLVMHFRQRPKKKKLLDTLKQLPSLTNLELYVALPFYLTTPYDIAWASHPLLRSLSTHLSLIPYFLSIFHSVSKQITSLNITCDQNSSRDFMNPERWVATVQMAGLDTCLRSLGLEGTLSIDDATSHAVPLLVGLQNVTTLTLRGNFMAPILDAMSRDSSLLPILRRIEMRSTDIDESVIESFLNSRRGSGQHRPISIREVVFDHCSNITRDFSDRVRLSVDSLTVYC